MAIKRLWFYGQWENGSTLSCKSCNNNATHCSVHHNVNTSQLEVT